MKKLLGFICFGFLLSAFTFITDLGDIINGIKAGNATSVSKYFDNTIEISLAGKSNSYSKSQGEAILRDFFTNNTVKSLNVVHQGQSGTSEYFIGTLVTNNGNYRTTLNLKKKGEKQILQEIKFDN
jgi:Domain of unknown function (DUF4783)